MVVVDQVRIPLVGFPAQKAVEALESPPQRPASLPGGRIAFVAGCEVPLADRVGVPPLSVEHLGDHAVLERDPRREPRKPRRRLGNAGHVVRRRVAAIEQAGARRRTQRGGVEIRVPQTVLGDPTHRWRLDRTTERFQGPIPDVVPDDHQARSVLPAGQPAARKVPSPALHPEYLPRPCLSTFGVSCRSPPSTKVSGRSSAIIAPGRQTAEDFDQTGEKSSRDENKSVLGCRTNQMSWQHLYCHDPLGDGVVGPPPLLPTTTSPNRTICCAGCHPTLLCPLMGLSAKVPSRRSWGGPLWSMPTVRSRGSKATSASATRPPPWPTGRPTTTGIGRSTPTRAAKFVNDRTGHGMFVSIDNVYSF